MIEFIHKSGNPDYERKGCDDCKHLKGAASLWCSNEEAAKANGTTIPKFKSCSFWEPMRSKSELSFKEKMFGDFIYVDL